MSRSTTWARVLPLLLLTAACDLKEPFVRANPLDSGSIYDISLTGPDSSHSRNERIRLTVQSDPPFPDDNYFVQWSANDYAECIPPGSATCRKVRYPIAVSAGGGEFSVIDIDARYRSILLVAHFGDVEVAHTIHIGQKAVALDLSCAPWSLPFDSCDNAPFDRGSAIALYTRMIDADHALISRKVEYAMERGSVVSRDSGIVRPQPLIADPNGVIRLDAVAAGTTWVVMRVDDAVDSVQVTVAP